MAEVKVKVTAQNEVRTGLQQALQETKKFGEEAKRAVSQGTTIDPFKDDDRLGPLRDLQRQARELRELARSPVEPSSVAPPVDGDFASASQRGAAAIRGLATDLANATSPAQIFEAVIRRASTAMGGLIAATAGFALGSLIRKTLEDAAAGLQSLTDQSQSLQQSFSNLSAPTTTFDQLANAIRGASAQIEALEEANRKLQSGIGFQLADYVNAFDLSTAADRETESGVSNARAALANAIGEATRRELELAKARTDEERKLIALQANREELLSFARRADSEISGKAPRAGRRSAEENLQRLFDAQDGRESGDRERSLQAQADKQRAINEDNRRSLEERLQREKQGLADLEQFGGAGVDLLREQATARIDDLEKRITAEKERAAAVTQREAEQREQATKRAAQSLATEIEQRDFAALSPADQKAKIAADTAALIAGAESGAISPAEAAQRALELQRREDALAGAAGGITGSAGASSLQRIGFASNEFFDTRNKKDPSEAVNKVGETLKRVYEIIKSGEPLVLPSNS